MSCEKDAITTDRIYSTEVEKLYAKHINLQAENDYTVTLTKEDIDIALSVSQTKTDCSYQCCYNAVDLLSFLACFGLPNPPSATCAEDADLNCDGAVNVLDYVIILSYFGCESVEANFYNINGDLTDPSNNIASQSQITSQIRNGTLIGGTIWQLSPNTVDEARWYYDGVLVSNNIPSLQLQYPGASPSDYDVAIDCNYGWHEITLEVDVDCNTYSVTTCINVKMQGVKTNCKSDYCTQ